MSLEDAAVVAEDGSVIHWHSPPGRTPVEIPDSQELWDVLFRNKDRLGGVAHTHPGTGYPSPSLEDLTTFEAVEAGLQKRIRWWILSASHSIVIEWDAGRKDYRITEFTFPRDEPAWMGELRARSFPEMALPGW